MGVSQDTILGVPIIRTIVWLTKFHGLGLGVSHNAQHLFGGWGTATTRAQVLGGGGGGGGGGGYTSWVEAIGIVQMPVYCVVPKPLLPYHHPEAV